MPLRPYHIFRIPERDTSNAGAGGELPDKPGILIKALGFSRGQIYEWLALYRRDRLDTLTIKPVLGAKHKLDDPAIHKARICKTTSHKKTPSTT